MAEIRCGMYITPKKRPKFGYAEFVLIAKAQGVLIEDLDLEGEHSKLPSNLDAILHKVRKDLCFEDCCFVMNRCSICR